MMVSRQQPFNLAGALRLHTLFGWFISGKLFIKNNLRQGCPTRGPRKGFEWPVGLFRNYQYYQLSVIATLFMVSLHSEKLSFNVCFLVS